MSDADTFLDRAAEILGPRGLTRDAELVDPWLTDWRGRFTGNALAMASPASTREVSRLLVLCSEHGVPVVPQGGNSGMCGGATPDTSGRSLLLSLRRMDAIRSLKVAGREIVCESGVILQVLHEAADREGLRFPLTLGGKGSATVGGLISTNAGGTQVLRHGSMRTMVLGLEAVLADGSVFQALTPLKKDNRGFDLKQVLIGSEGTLGIVTAATLRLVPAIAERRVAWVGVDSLETARKLLLFYDDMAGQALEGFEVLPQQVLDDVIVHLPDARPPLAGPHPWHCLIELVAECASAKELGEQTERILADALEHDLIADAVIAANEAQADQFWMLRESISAAQRAKGPAVQHDISVAVDRMPAFVEFAVTEIEACWPGTSAIAFGHLGDGNVHFHVVAPSYADPEKWHADQGETISSHLYDMVTDWNGSISAEHGIGQLKLATLARLGDPVALSMQRSIKRALDPLNILNPGKLVSLAPDRTSA